MPQPVTTTRLLERLAAFTERRHEVLAGNVAHATTPNYERRDLDVAGFDAALAKAVEQRRTGTSASEASRHGVAKDPFDPELFEASTDTERNVRFHDGGVRSIETEMTELTRNSMLHTFAIEVMTAQFDMLRTVVSERA